MKALLTAEMDESLVPELDCMLDVETDGWYVSNELLSESDLIRKMKHKDVLITSYDKVTRNVIENCPQLKLIACTRSNPINIDFDAATERKIPIIYTPGRNANSAAEYTIAMMLNIARHIPFAYKELHDSNSLIEKEVQEVQREALKEDITWGLGIGSPYIEFKGSELKDKTLGIIGYGQIGKKVAGLARAFGMKIYVNDPYVQESEAQDVTLVGFDRLLESSDFITSHAAVVPDTIGLLNKAAFERMKKNAYLINTSRGAIINEDDLVLALRNRTIAGAALDVFAAEPLSAGHPFLCELDNVLVTPHIAGATFEAITNHSKMIIEEIKRFMNKEPLEFQYKK
ncbi:2-hydroxyacid dehydrogenase [Sporosarcina sp. G11-34]|uniref:2-hydroxyacid dehydrogenase n=1 Tax=Sporosarcina sp. G11-34 TaxID=2849605 RepID=UPI0022A905A6|nr:2-hydroxyacid dehydrogenase [Sporosarcina sp. G11-34]MCZ2258101.1 2-hydroxyacid dehydrogenase [Sporosarcina sp. G11-34]